ncbi:hypothetical protein H4R22_003276, partial [Coemansia sp. RSA 1290]
MDIVSVLKEIPRDMKIADFVNLLSEHNIVVEKMEVLNEIIYEKDVDVQPADKTFYLDRGEEIEI